MGVRGAGRLNLKAGQAAIAIPFVGGQQKFIQRSHLAEQTLGIFSAEQRLVELNGQIIREDGERSLSHRYSLGISREEVESDDKFKGLFATYMCNLNEIYSLGAIYRSGEEGSGASDVSYNKYGLAGEADFETIVVTAGYFGADRSGLAEQVNYLVEAAYIPTAKISLGARYDVVKEKGKKSARSHNLMARYNILSNVFAMLEYRGLEDDGHVTGSNEEETKLRLFFVALF